LRICFVCLGNICRSPTAEGIMNHLVRERGLADHIEVDSAGTSAFQLGNPPDERSAAEARNRGIALSGRARQFQPDDFRVFDLVVAMDRHNLRDLRALAPEPGLGQRVVLLRSFDPDEATTTPLRGPLGPGTTRRLDVPDPYNGGADGFATVYDLVERACRGLLDHLVATDERAGP